MAKWQLFTGLSISAAILGWLGVKKYREALALQQLSMLPAKPAFQFVRVQSNLVDGLVHLIVKNPTGNNYRVKNLEAVIVLNDNGRPGAYLASVKSVSASVLPQQETLITIPVTIALNQLLALAKNIIFSSGTATIFLTGRVTYVTSGLPVPVPFSFSIDVRDQLNLFFQQNNIPITL